MRKTLILTALACLIGTAAFAHAFLDHASPPVGAELAVSPKALELTYTEPVEPLFCQVEVTDAAGKPVTDGKPTARDGGRTLVVPLKSLPPGAYQVEWHVVSVDTHKTEGHFQFTIRR